MSATKLSVLFLTAGPVQDASARLRVYQYIPWLESRGVKCYVMPAVREAHYRWVFRSTPADRTALLVSTVVRNLHAMLQLGHFDVIFAQRELLTRIYPLFEQWIARTHGRFVFDFDDLIFARPPGSSSWWYRAASTAFAQSPAERIVGLSSQVIAGSSYLKSRALEYNPNVTMIPTVVDTNLWMPQPQRDSSAVPTIVWTGNPSSSYYLESAVGVLQKIARTHVFRLLIVGASRATESVFENLPNTVFRTWSLDTELSDLLEGDIGIMPVVDDIWSKGKCGLKAIQYMALGLPAVCSPFGANSEIVTHYQDGFLANTDSEWETCLINLLDDQELRRRIGAKARATAVARFSLEANAPKLLRVLEQA